MNANTILTTNFKYGEFWCLGVEPPEAYFENIKAVAVELQKVRTILGKSITITSGWRSLQHNTNIGGAKASQHLTGKGCDSRCNGINAYEYLTYLTRYTNFQGFGIANNFVHTDTRDKFTVWVY